MNGRDYEQALRQIISLTTLLHSTVISNDSLLRIYRKNNFFNQRVLSDAVNVQESFVIKAIFLNQL